MKLQLNALVLVGAAFVSSSPSAAQFGVGCQTLANETFESNLAGTLISDIISTDYQWFGPSSDFIAEMSPNCVTDLNGDGLINSADLAILLSQWGTSGSADLNGDNVVNSADLASLLASWGVCTTNSVNRVLQFGAQSQPSVITAGALTNQSFLPTFPSTLRVQYDSFVGSSNARLSMRFVDSTQFVSLFSVFSSLNLSNNHYTILGPLTTNIGAFFISGKTNRFGEPATIFVEFTKISKLAPPSVRVLVRDSETVALFGDAPVEIFPAGPFGPATTDTGVQAPNPSFIPTTIEGFQFFPSGSATGDPDRLVYVDNVRISNCPQ